MERLTDAEIAELRRLEHEAAPAPWRKRPVYDDERDAELAAAARNALLRLLDEIERQRQTNDLAAAGLIIGCPHDGEHALYCAGCCAQFDPGRMVLVHSVDCQFRGHERAER